MIIIIMKTSGTEQTQLSVENEHANDNATYTTKKHYLSNKMTCPSS